MKYLLALTLTITFCIANAQRVVRLTNTKSKNTVILREGKRVTYSLQDNKKKVGIINSINESSLVIGTEEIDINNISTLGRNNKAGKFWSIVFFVLGGGVIGSSIQNAAYDPCPSCTTVESSGSEYTAMGIAMGVGLIGVGTAITVRNQPKNLNDGWTIEIIPSD